MTKPFPTCIGTQTLKFSSFTEFLQWKECEEEATHTTYMYVTGEQTYCPKSTKQGNHFHAEVHWQRLCVHASHDLILVVPPTPYTDIRYPYYCICCRDGKYYENKKPRITTLKRCHQKPSCKLNGTSCLSRMYTDELSDGSVTVEYILVHNGHKLVPEEHKFLRETVSLQLSKGIPAKWILQGKTKVEPLHEFMDAIH